VASPQFNPSSPCAIGTEWMPFADNAATLNSPTRYLAAAVDSDRDELIRAIWLMFIARFSTDGCLGLDILDITGDQLPAFSDLATFTFYPASDLHNNADNIGFSTVFPAPVGALPPFIYTTINSHANTPGVDELANPFFNNSYARGGLGEQFNWAGQVAGCDSTQTGRWITTVSVVANTAELVLGGKQSGFTARAFIQSSGQVYLHDTAKALGGGGIEGDETRWSWFANPGSGFPWRSSDIDLFDVANNFSQGIGLILESTGDGDLRPVVARVRLEVTSAPTDQRLAVAALQPKTKQGWQRLALQSPQSPTPVNWHKLVGHKYLIGVRKTRGFFPIAIGTTDEPGIKLPGPPNWSSYIPPTNADSETQPTQRPRELGDELTACYGVLLETSGGGYSLDSQPYFSTSPEAGQPDALPNIGAFFDLPHVDNQHVITQRFTTPAGGALAYGWLQLRLSQVANSAPDPLTVELRDAGTSALQATWTISTDDMANPKRQWRRVGKRCDDVTIPTLTASHDYILRLSSPAPPAFGWQAQVLNGGTNQTPPQGLPTGAVAATFQGANAVTTKGAQDDNADLEFILSTVPDAPTGLAALGTVEVCNVARVQLTWIDPGIVMDCGLTFAAWELQRSDDAGVTWHTIKNITSQAVVVFADEEGVANRDASYRVRTVRSDGARSGWSNVATGMKTQSRPGLVFSSNVLSGRGIYCPDIVTKRPLEFPEKFAVVDLQGRDGHYVQRELENRGCDFKTTLLIRSGDQLCANAFPCADYTVSGRGVFAPLLALLREGLPYVCVCDEAGDRWFASVRSPKGDWQRWLFTGDPSDRDSRGNYTLDIEIYDTSPNGIPFASDVAPSVGPGSGSGSGSGA
jgi:hypothetical protein